MQRYLFSSLAQWITFGLLVLTCLIFWQFMLRDETSIQANTARRIDDQQLALRQVQTQVGTIDQLFNQYQHNREEIAFFQDQYLRQKAARIRGISKFLEETARKRRVRLEEIRYTTAPSRGGSLDIYTMDLPLTGRYRDIRQLIADIEASNMFLVISKLGLKSESGLDGAVGVDISLATFFEGNRP